MVGQVHFIVIGSLRAGMNFHLTSSHPPMFPTMHDRRALLSPYKP
jgi:hypothetical protein